MVDVSYRDKKRQLMAENIHRIAEKMSDEHGIARVMIEDVAQAAAISRRTFFNYFATKEDAILGLQAPKLTTKAKDAFVSNDGPLLERTVQLIIDVNSTALVPGVSVKEHIAIRKKYPELRVRLDYYTTQCEQIVRPIIAEYAGEVDAEIVLRVAGAILRHAYTSDADLKPTTVKNSIHKFLETIKRIS